MGRATLSKTMVWKAVAFGTGLGLSMLSYPVHATPASDGDTVKGLYEVLLTTMKNGGSRALDLEISKARQYAALEAAGVLSPDTIVVSGLRHQVTRRSCRTERPPGGTETAAISLLQKPP